MRYPHFPRRISTAGALAATIAACLLAAPGAQAADSRIPPWPTVRAGVPASLLRTPTTTTQNYLAKLDRRLDRRVRAAALGSNISVRVEDLASGDVVYSHRGSVPLVPASTEKTATALAVLSAAGPEKVLPTKAILNADATGITLVGGGDPVLTGDNLDELATQAADSIKATGDAAVRFKVRYDDSLFAQPGLPSGWPGSYVGDYSANPTALTRYGSYSSDSAKETATYFRRRLKAHGLRPAPGVARDKAPSDGLPLAEFTEHTIGDALWSMLQYSDNTIAEVMLRHVALARGGDTSTTGSAAAVKAELASLGVPTGSMRTVDGSGLSRSNRISAQTLVAITRAAMNPDRPELSTGFRYSGVPLAGISGTLEDRFHAPSTSCAVGRIMAKTGTLSDVVALSGVTGSTDGRLRAFAIMVNNKPSWASLSATRYRVDRIAAAVNGCR